MAGHARARLRLGIDAGGTFTDAVLIDAGRRVVASAKCLTTPFDLALGIEGALGMLPRERLHDVVLVALSTTLTTNAVVEGKGAPVCALLAGYDEGETRSSGLRALLGAESVVQLAGGHDTDGRERCPLDLQGARAAILHQAPRVAAFAISAIFGVRNPAHEIALRELVRESSDRPVTCGHELAASLGAPRRALTAALNARMIPHVRSLIASVEAVLARFGVAAPLMMVRGDGSLTSAASALLRPVGTVLSGPAASVIGACALSGRADGVVADMGGTTTDIAIVRGGRPELAFDGTLVGSWRPMIESVKVHAIGIGGDSEVRWGGSSGVLVGPRRVVPLSLLGHEHPGLIATLARQVTQTPHPTQARFALRLQSDESQLARLDAAEQQAFERLLEGPVDMEWANASERALARALARLERRGLAIYTGFTPTDAAHVLGLSDHWNGEAARLGARIWGRQMRQIHGCGRWEDHDAVGPSQRVYDCVVDAICHKLVEAGLEDAGHFGEANTARMAKLLTALVLRAAAGEVGARPCTTPVFTMRFAEQLPLVAVGAPAACWYPGVTHALGMELVVPPHAEVANAVGAVLGEVEQRAHIAVTQPDRGVFRVFAHNGPRDFRSLGEALAHARELAAIEARALALEAGAAQVTVETRSDETSAADDIGTSIFFEARISAIARGPAREAAAEPLYAGV